MEFMTPVMRWWLLAVAGTVVVGWLITTSTFQRLLRSSVRWVTGKRWLRFQKIARILACVVLCSTVLLTIGLVGTNYSGRQQGMADALATYESLMTDILRFIDQRNDQYPDMPTTTEESVLDTWFQEKLEHRETTESLFTKYYYQEVIQLGYELRRLEVITDDELKHLCWMAHPEHPVVGWVLDALEEYGERLR